MSEVPALPSSSGCWTDGALPSNARAGPGTVISGRFAFKRFLAELPDALVIGAGCTMEGVQFAVGPRGRLYIGDCCYFTSTVLLCELEVRIGSCVMIGWNTVIADSDFHPLAPALRIQDALACSPLGAGRQRPPIECRPVVIEDDVWIGPACTILKGVHIGRGAIIEPGAVIVRDVPAGARMAGNPARPL